MSDETSPQADLHAKEEAFLKACKDAVHNLLIARDLGKHLYGTAVADGFSEIIKRIHQLRDANVPGFLG